MDRKLYRGVPDRRLLEVQPWHASVRARPRFGEPLLRALFRKIGHLSSTLQYLTAALLVALVGLADTYANPELSLSIFYVIPIAILAWYRGWKIGRIAVIGATIVWLISDMIAGPQYSVSVIRYWNAGVRFGFFYLSGFLLSELRTALDHARQLARTDVLTGVANSRSFLERAKQEVARQQRYYHPLSIVFVDCDDFKHVNDTYGHAAGDALLQTIATCIHSSIRSVDMVARLGGDEFAVLLPESDAHGADAVCDKMRAVLGEAVSDYGVTFSLGIVTYHQPPLNSEELVRTADEVMYEAKREGKNCVRHRVMGADVRQAR